MDQELVQYLDQQFGGVNRRFEQVDQRFEQVDRHLESVDRRIDGVRQEVYVGFDEVKRHNGVLIEDLRRQLQLMAEGLMIHIDVRHAEDRAYNDEHFRENRTLFQLCFQRLENLERKGQG